LTNEFIGAKLTEQLMQVLTDANPDAATKIQKVINKSGNDLAVQFVGALKSNKK
jgi:hypothetical protein